MKLTLIIAALVLATFFIVNFVAHTDPFAGHFSAFAEMLGLLTATAVLIRNAAVLPASDSFAGGWIRITIGVCVWLIAEIMELVEIILEQPSYGTVADGFWLLGYAPLLSAMVLWMRNYRTPDGRFYSTGSFLLFGFFVTLFSILILPQILEPSRSIFSKLLDFSYPFLDFLLILLSLELIRRARFHQLISTYHWLHFTAFTLLMASDLILSYESAGESVANKLLDATYFLTYVCIALSSQIYCKGRPAAVTS